MGRTSLRATGLGTLGKSVTPWLAAVNERPRLTLAVIALLLAAQIRPWWLPEADGRSYLSMARSLATGGCMRNLGSPHLWYFPGYSLLLSPLYLAADPPFWLLSAFQWSAAIVFLAGVYCWATSVARSWAVWIAATCAVNEGVWIWTGRTMSEMAFMCGWIWSANAALALGRTRTVRGTVLRGFVAALLLALTSLIRPAGVLLALGFGLCLGWQAWRREISPRRALATTLLLGVPASAAVLGCLYRERQTATVVEGRTYLNNFGDSAAHPIAAYGEGLRIAIRDSGRVIVPGMFKAYQQGGWQDANLLVYVPVCAALAAGWWKLARETRDPLLLATPFYIALHIAYPYESGARFYVPLIPVFVTALVRLIAPLRGAGLLAVGVLFAAHLIAAVVYQTAIEGPRARQATAHWNEIQQVAGRLGRGADRVAAVGLAGDHTLMLELALDRRVARVPMDYATGIAEWIVTMRGAPDVRPFEAAFDTPTFSVRRRRPDRAPGASSISLNRRSRPE